jgi:hypothetical protein
MDSRDSNDHEATAMVKAQFMQLWDGLETRPQGQVSHFVGLSMSVSAQYLILHLKI